MKTNSQKNKNKNEDNIQHLPPHSDLFVLLQRWLFLIIAMSYSILRRSIMLNRKEKKIIVLLSQCYNAIN